jgi:hypothetical protein
MALRSMMENSAAAATATMASTTAASLGNVGESDKSRNCHDQRKQFLHLNLLVWLLRHC